MPKATGTRNSKSLPYSVSKARKEERAIKNAAFDEDITKLLQYIDEEVQKLSEKHQRKYRKVVTALRLGAQLSRKHRQTTLFNASVSLAGEGYINYDDEESNAEERGLKHDEKPQTFDETVQKAKVLYQQVKDLPEDHPARIAVMERAEELKQAKERKTLASARSPQAAARDVKEAVKGIADNLESLHETHGVHYVVLVVPNTYDTSIVTYGVHSTGGSRFLEAYMKFDVSVLLQNFQSFVVSGIKSLANKPLSSKQELRNLMSEQLAVITEEPKLRMEYSNWGSLSKKHAVKLVGWPVRDVPFKTLSNLGEKQIITLLRAFNCGDLRFVPSSSEGTDVLDLAITPTSITATATASALMTATAGTATLTPAPTLTPTPTPALSLPANTDNGHVRHDPAFSPRHLASVPPTASQFQIGWSSSGETLTTGHHSQYMLFGRDTQVCNAAGSSIAGMHSSPFV